MSPCCRAHERSAEYSRCAQMSISTWDRPPAGIAIAEFFQTWLPAAYRATGRSAPTDAPVVRASLSGEGGGAWDLQAQDDELVVEPATRDAPGVWIRQPAAD